MLASHKKSDQKPYMFYIVKNTDSYYEHTCDLSETFYNAAIKSKRGEIKVNIDGMTALLLVLKDMPQATPITLRPLMLRYIHHWKPLSFQYIANFRHRVALYQVRHLSFEYINMDHAQKLVSPKTMYLTKRWRYYKIP